jgi:polyisoprenoid-binding protein YceI
VVTVMFAAFLAVGCSNPTADKTAATVSAPVEVAAPAPAPDAGAPAAKVYTFTDKDNGIDFTGYKVTGSHVGGFGKFEGKVTVPGEDLTQARIELTIDMKSTYSDAPDLTKKLVSTDFFEAGTYPTATFTSTSIAATPAGGDFYDVTGNLTLHGVTKGITFPATISVQGDTLKTTAEFTIKRFEWNVNYEGMADDLIREDVLLNFEIQAKA